MIVTLKLPPSLLGTGKIASISSNASSIILNGGTKLHTLLADHIRNLAATRHATAQRLGAKPTSHFKAADVGLPEVSGSTVRVKLYTPGIARARHDVTIVPVEARALAIPKHKDAYGISPRAYNMYHPKGDKKQLFRPKGKDYLARSDGKKITVMYLLRRSVHQRMDPTLLPTDQEMINAFAKGCREAINHILANGI